MILVTGSGCSPRDRVPKEFPEQEEMAEIIADLYIAENVVTRGQSGPQGDPSDSNIPGYYKGVLEKYELTAAEFDTIRKWYAAHPYHFQEVYDQAIVNLNRRKAELEQKLREEREEKEKTPEIIDLWKKDRNLTLNAEDTIDRRLPFHIDLDSLTGGEIRFSTMYKFLREDMTKDGQMMLIVEYRDTIADTITQKLEKTFQSRSVTLVSEIDSAMPAVSVSGLMFDHDTTEATAIEFSRIRLEHLPEEIKAQRDGESTPRLERPEMPER
ncbi:MAG: DUF4296 domain-containing protein [Marinilabiliaceae bacterium]